MLIETNEVIYETFFQHAQIEVTGFCNMKCKHCRASEQENVHMSLTDIQKVLTFVDMNRETDFRLTISGGEPFLHPQIIDIVKLVNERNINDIIITTNGSMVTDDYLRQLNELMISNLCIQVSLDSINTETHDAFRGFSGAFDRAVTLLKKLADYSNIKSSIRMTVTSQTQNQVEEMIDFAYKLGVDRVGIGVVIPFFNWIAVVVPLVFPSVAIYLRPIVDKNK